MRSPNAPCNDTDVRSLHQMGSFQPGVVWFFATHRDRRPEHGAIRTPAIILGYPEREAGSPVREVLTPRVANSYGSWSSQPVNLVSGG